MGPIVGIAFDVAATEDGSEKFFCAGAFVFVAAVFEDFGSRFFGDDKGFIQAGFDAVVDLDIPIFEGCADGFDFLFDRLFEWVEDDPGVA